MPSFSLPTYGQAIQNALANGYKVDTLNGVIYGLKGLPLTISLAAGQRYPTVSLVVVDMPCRYYVVPAHKIMAYALWGVEAFRPGVQVRHGSLGVTNISEANLTLGTASQNNLDKPQAVRLAAARTARASQPREGHNAKLTENLVTELRAEYAMLRQQYPTKFPAGVIGGLEHKYGIGKTNISDIIKEKIWKIAK